MDINQKITNRDELAKLIPTLRRQGKRVGYTSGVFDLIHPGHVDYLSQAKKLCDILIVGINSDSSVKLYKGPERPICSEIDRAFVVAGLESVDYVFTFSERNNNLNIELLKPSYYIKAGDYSKDKLSSAPIVEKYGGEVKLINFTSGHSSSKIIDKIALQALSALIAEQPLESQQEAPVVFLDRDGTINEEVFYLHEPAKLQLLPGAIEGLKKLSQAGYRLVMVTNQPGIGLGYFTKEDFFLVTRALFTILSKEGIKFSKIYFSPYSESEKSSCRKPETGMIDRAKQELKIDLANSFVVGDMTSDIELAKRAGLKSILVKTGAGGFDKKFDAVPDFVASNLSEAADFIISSRGK